MDITVEKITPTVARKYLGHNTANRGLRSSRVRSYAEQMKRGQWLLTGDPIRFTADGTLVDGQHRLAAIIESAAPQHMAVARDVPENSFRVIDSGLGRGPGDSLAGDVKNASHKASSIRQLYVIECGGDPRNSEDRNAVTRTDLSEYYEDHHEEIESQFGVSMTLYRSGAAGNKTAWLTFLVLANRINPEWCAEFAESVRTGANLAVGDPRLALRNVLGNARYNVYRGAAEHLALIIKTWNAWLYGYSRQTVRFEEREDFPTLAHRRGNPKRAPKNG